MGAVRSGGRALALVVASARGTRGLALLRRAALVLLVASGLDVLVNGANLVARPAISKTVTVPSAVAGIGQIAFEVVGGEGRRVRGCALFADTPASWSGPVLSEALRALRTDPAYEAVLVAPTRGTPPLGAIRVAFPVGIAFFGTRGRFLEGVEVAPCGTGACLPPGPPSRARVAAIAPSGHLGALGVGPGSRLVVLGACGLGAPV